MRGGKREGKEKGKGKCAQKIHRQLNARVGKRRKEKGGERLEVSEVLTACGNSSFNFSSTLENQGLGKKKKKGGGGGGVTRKTTASVRLKIGESSRRFLSWDREVEKGERGGIL